jgi:L-ribulokinase
MTTGRRLAIGVDFGTESGRVLILDLASGTEVAAKVVTYPHGVIDERLPSNGAELPPDTALQDPGDYLEVLVRGVPEAMRDAHAKPEEVIGLGIDTTACTVLPVTFDGTPLCELERWRDHPHAWVKLWKHHSAQPVADQLNAVAVERKEPFLNRYGGRLSSEWYFPKLIETWLQDRDVFDAMDAFVEATDWITWQLTGELARASCTAGYKACWSARDGIPSHDYFTAAYPGIPDLSGKLGSTFFPPGHRAGTLRSELAGRLGLAAQTAVAVGNVDSFVSLPGIGVEQPGTFVMVVGTSICDLVIDARGIEMPGITGVMEDGILPGCFGYEAGQPAVGDMFAWFGGRLLGRSGHDGGDWYAELEGEAARVAPGASGLVALDWWNGNRTILGDADLSGVIAGVTLATTPAEFYRALLEAVAFGTRRIVENFADHDLHFDGIVACGGIAERSALMMQLIADVTGVTVTTTVSHEIPARGSALFGALAAGAARGGFDDIGLAIEQLRPGVARQYVPATANHAIYDAVYAIFRGLHDDLGREHVDWLHELKRIRRDALAGRT